MLNAVTSIILILNFFKAPMILDTVFNVAVKFPQLILWKVTNDNKPEKAIKMKAHYY